MPEHSITPVAEQCGETRTRVGKKITLDAPFWRTNPGCVSACETVIRIYGRR